MTDSSFKVKNKISFKYLNEILKYEPFTGIFIWKVNKGKRGKIGYKAGCKIDKGYICIRIDGKGYKAHILAWFYMTGKWPIDEIDHKNRIKDDNRFKNLRIATKSQNQTNREKNKNNTSGYKDIFWHKQNKKWIVRIVNDSKHHFLGSFLTKKEAIEIYNKKIIELSGEFSFLNKRIG